MGDSAPYCPECDDTIAGADMEKDPLCPMCGSELASGPEAAGEEDAQEGAAANPGDGQHRGDSALTALERTLGEMFEDQAMGMDERAPERPDLDSIKVFDLSPSSAVMVRAEVQLGDIRAEASQAAFGPLLSGSGPDEDSVRATLAVANPVTAHEELRNAPSLRDKIVVVERGRCPFAAKAARCAAAGAAAVVVVQTADTFPYTMTDSEGAATREGEDLRTPTVMVNRADGARLRGAAGGEALLRRWRRDSACPICREELVGQRVMLLQCHHVFHEACLREWFQRSVTCPLCRTSAARAEPTGGDGGEEAGGALYV